MLPALSAARASLHAVTAELDAWLGRLAWPWPRMGLLGAANLRSLLALPAKDPAAVQPYLPLLFNGALPPELSSLAGKTG